MPIENKYFHPLPMGTSCKPISTCRCKYYQTSISELCRQVLKTTLPTRPKPLIPTFTTITNNFDLLYIIYKIIKKYGHEKGEDILNLPVRMACRMSSNGYVKFASIDINHWALYFFRHWYQWIEDFLSHFLI